MTDKEQIELALRRIAARAASNPFSYWFRELADEIAKTSSEDAAQTSAQGKSS